MSLDACWRESLATSVSQTSASMPQAERIARTRRRSADGAYLLVEEVARRGKVTPLHAHPAEEETFYILEGEVVIHLDGDERSLGVGSLVSVPAGLAHAYLVTSEVARSLILITPGSGPMEQFFRQAGEPAPKLVLPEAGPLDIDRIAAAAERTGAVKILGPPPFGASA
jgi:quercetin dioxygenase-like cupin family protein